jgi:polysaccharide biosynthesis protein PslH
VTPPDARPRVLYVTHRVPYPPDKGDRIRNYHVLRELAKVARVWLAALADEPVTDTQHIELNKLCERVAILPAGGKGRWVKAGLSLLAGKSLSEGLFDEAKLADQLTAWAKETTFHSTLISASSLARYQQLPALAKTPAHVDLVDVDSQKWFDFADATRGPKSWLYRTEGKRVRKLEQRLANRAGTLSLVSKAETDVFNGFTKPNAAITATNGVDLAYFHPMDTVPPLPACAFVGAMDYFPNIDAAVWFATEIFPHVRASYPEAQFHIIGRKPTVEVLKLGTLPGVKVLGTVPDVRPHVATARLAVCPIRVARGLQNKVIEAMAMAKPTLSAPAAMAALHAIPGVHLVRPTTVQEWVKEICELWLDIDRRAELGKAARKYVEDYHDWPKCLAPLVQRVVS